MFKLVFDEGESNEQTVGDDDKWATRLTASSYSWLTFTGTVDLDAGPHTVKVYGKEVSGSGIQYLGTGTVPVGGCRIMLLNSSGSGAGGALTDTAVLSGDYTITGAWADVDNGGGDELTVTVTVAQDEQLLLSLVGWVSQTLAGSTFIRWVIDSDNYATVTESNNAGYGSNMSHTWISPALDAGSHTIKIQAYRSAASLLNAGARLSVTRYRGGQVPIRNSGETIVDKPAAFDFIAPGFSVSNSGGTARVSLLAQDGYMKLPEATTDPTVSSTDGYLYSKDDAGDIELFYMDDSSNTVQITKDGYVNSHCSYGEMYISSSSATATSQTPTYTKVLGTYADGYLSDFTHSNGTLTYTSPITRMFSFNAQISAISSSADVFYFRVAVNGTTIAKSEGRRRISSVANEIGSISLVCILELTQNDEIEIYVTRESASAVNVTAEKMSIVLRSM
jgi:hypothetical protein